MKLFPAPVEMPTVYSGHETLEELVKLNGGIYKNRHKADEANRSDVTFTPEMQAAGLLEIHRDATAGDRVHAIYLAMRALEPVDLVSHGELAALKERDEAWAVVDIANEYADDWCKRYRDEQRESAGLRDEIAALKGELSTTMVLAPDARLVDERNIALKERDEAYRYLRGIFEHVAPQCAPLPDLMGICTQVDNALAGARIDAEGWRMTVLSLENRVKELESYTAAMARTYDENSTLGAMNERLRDEIAALTAEKSALHDTVVKFTTASVPVPDPPKRNPFRTFDNDPRRMGP